MLCWRSPARRCAPQRTAADATGGRHLPAPHRLAAGTSLGFLYRGPSHPPHLRSARRPVAGVVPVRRAAERHQLEGPAHCRRRRDPDDARQARDRDGDDARSGVDRDCRDFPGPGRRTFTCRTRSKTARCVRLQTARRCDHAQQRARIDAYDRARRMNACRGRHFLPGSALLAGAVMLAGATLLAGSAQNSPRVAMLEQAGWDGDQGATTCRSRPRPSRKRSRSTRRTPRCGLAPAWRRSSSGTMRKRRRITSRRSISIRS